MKNFVFFLAVFMLLKPALPVADFLWNYGYIIKELCINKEKPELECNGKCYLKSELAKASEQEFPFSKNEKTSFPSVEILFYQDIDTLSTSNSFILKEVNLFFYSNLYLHEIDHSFFHPPSFQV